MKQQFILQGIFLSVSCSILSANPEPQPQMSFTEGASGTWNSEWIGREKRLYFFQWTTDLVTWHYAPFIAFGIGLHSYGFNPNGEPNIFVRLPQEIDSLATNLQQAQESDLDGDGLPNLYEVTAPGFDPMLISGFIDSDGDGLNDVYEVFHFGSTAFGQPGLDSDGDSFLNSFEARMAMNPNVGYTLMTLSEIEVHLPN